MIHRRQESWLFSWQVAKSGGCMLRFLHVVDQGWTERILDLNLKLANLWVGNTSHVLLNCGWLD